MTDNEIRIAIAEKCGWTRCFGPWQLSRPENDPLHGQLQPKGSEMEGWLAPGWNKTDSWRARITDELPDYPKDLNAVHEIEETLTYVNGCALQYGCILQQVVLRGRQVSDLDARFKVAHATDRQRCEALLRTWNLWKD